MKLPSYVSDIKYFSGQRTQKHFLFSFRIFYCIWPFLCVCLSDCVSYILFFSLFFLPGILSLFILLVMESFSISFLYLLSFSLCLCHSRCLTSALFCLLRALHGTSTHIRKLSDTHSFIHSTSKWL